MRNLRLGFTLLEVLVALLLITTGLLGLAGTLGPIARLAGEGRAKGRIALLLESRMDQLRAELLRAAPACVPPTAGSQRHPDGIVEAWSTAAASGLVELRITAGIAGPSDTLVTRVPCP